MRALADAVAAVATTDWRGLPGPVLLDRIRELDRQLNRLQAVRLQALEAADRTGATTAVHGSTQAFCRTDLHSSPGRASRDVHLARDLADALPLTAVALADGSIGVDHAQLIATLVGVIPADDLERIEAALVELAQRHDPTLLRQAVAHARELYTPEPDKAEADQTAYANRRLHATAGLHGNGLGSWQLHPVGHETVMTALNALSAPSADDDRTAEQRRADALVDVCRFALDHGYAPTVGGVKPHVTVVVPAPTLAGQPGEAAVFRFGATSGARWAQRLACDADITAVSLSSTGAVLDAGRTRRLFSAAQRRAIEVRDGSRCIWKGCHSPWYDVHHIRHWADGGTTDIDNGTLLCGHHHDRVHLYGHAIRRGPGGYAVNLIPGSDPRWLAGHGHGHDEPDEPDGGRHSWAS